jgi:hypothetical protein
MTLAYRLGIHWYFWCLCPYLIGWVLPVSLTTCLAWILSKASFWSMGTINYVVRLLSSFSLCVSLCLTSLSFSLLYYRAMWSFFTKATYISFDGRHYFNFYLGTSGYST